MDSSPPSPSLICGGPERTVGLAAQRRAAGRVAGVVISLGALAALAAGRLVSHPGASSSFYVVAALALCTGVACCVAPWDRLSPPWLHAIPMIATVEVAFGVRFAGAYGDIAATYFVSVAVFVSYAFSSRRAIAAHLAFTSAAATLPLFYLHSQGGQHAARARVSVLLLVVIAGIVTVLREGLEQRQRELEELALRDPLTGVGNYRLLSERLDYDVARHRRSGGSLTVLLLDLDGFKEINDTFGHLVGDRVLVEVARALSSGIRAQDTLARQGGDEFSILAPDTSNEQAARLAERVRDTLAAVANGSLTTSVGWATYPTHANDPSGLLTHADADLRRAKRELGVDQRERGASQRAGILRLVEGLAS
jgi:diguanylate cyclase (GGDEF)-like protein